MATAGSQLVLGRPSACKEACSKTVMNLEHTRACGSQPCSPAATHAGDGSDARSPGTLLLQGQEPSIPKKLRLRPNSNSGIHHHHKRTTDVITPSPFTSAWRR
jgi:hypothetical protein